MVIKMQILLAVLCMPKRFEKSQQTLFSCVMAFMIYKTAIQQVQNNNFLIFSILAVMSCNDYCQSLKKVIVLYYCYLLGTASLYFSRLLKRSHLIFSPVMLLLATQILFFLKCCVLANKVLL